MTDSHFNVLVTSDIFEKHRKRIDKVAEPINWIPIDFANKPANYLELISQADVLIARAGPNTIELDAAKNLKLIQVPMAGYDKFDLKAIAAKGIPISNNGGANAISVADHTLLLILALYRQLLAHHQSVIDGSWINRKHSNLELEGKTLGIVGFGKIGQLVAQRAFSFGMKITYYDIVRQNEIADKLQAQFLNLNELLNSSDIVSFHVPLTSKTHGMINKELLSQMKKGALLINTARGEIQKEEDLFEALKSSHLKGAGLDVFETEPLPQSSPLTQLPNVVLTPHCGPSKETTERLIEHIIANITRVIKGDEPTHLIVDYETLG